MYFCARNGFIVPALARGFSSSHCQYLAPLAGKVILRALTAAIFQLRVMPWMAKEAYHGRRYCSACQLWP